MRPGQWKLGVGVVECRRLPGGCAVALSAIMGEIVLNVIGICGGIIIISMT